MSVLSAEFTSLIDALTQQYSSESPQDPLQFCADFFNARLRSDRAQLRAHAELTANTSTATTGSSTRNIPAPTSAVGMADSSTSPFGAGSGMHRLDEEDENGPMASPTNTRNPQPLSSTASDSKPPSSFSSGFGNFGGFGAAMGSAGAAADASGAAAAGSGVGSLDPQPIPNNYNLNRRTSVSAESMNPVSSANDNWSPPHHNKTAEQAARLRKATEQNFLFSHLDDEQQTQVLGALQEKQIPTKGIKVISQGDVGDYFYVVESGKFDIHVNSSGKIEPGPTGLGDKVADAGPGGTFGELALMYNAPRAATVVSAEPSTLWALDRVTFRRILMDSAFQRRRMYESFLDSVPLLAPLSAYERSKIADALETRKYGAGASIIDEGGLGDEFFMLEAGEAEVFKKGTEGAIARYKKGDYFGELALLNDAPRAATVLAASDVKVATLGKEAFQRLLGPVERVLRGRNYDEAVDPLASK